jgi:hypothetical protein
MWMQFYLHFPVKDFLHQMVFVQDVLEGGVFSRSLTDWLAPHAGAHRIADIRLAMVMDFKYFGGQNNLIYSITWVSILAMLLVILKTFRQSYKPELAVSLFVAGISLIFLTSYTQLENLINPINSSWYLALAASALSIYAITSRSTPPSALYFVIAYLLAVVAAFSNFSGVIVWLLLPVLIGFRSLRAGLLASVITGLFLTPYITGVSPSDGGQFGSTALDSPEFSIGEQLTILAYSQWMKGLAILSKAFSYLGSPLSIEHPSWAAVMVGLSIVVIVSGWWELFKRRFSGGIWHHPWLETMLAMATLNLGIAIATQLGRIFFSDPTAARYQTVVMSYWLSICALILYFGLKTRRDKSMWQFASSTLCLVLAALLLLLSPLPIARAVKFAETADRISALALLGIPPGNEYGILSPLKTPDIVIDLDRYYRANSTGYWHNVSSQIEFDGSVVCDEVNLSVEPSEWPNISVVTGHIDSGWAYLHRQVPVSTAHGKVSGVLTRVFGRNVMPTSLLSREGSYWRGYFPSDEILDKEVFLHLHRSLLSDEPCRMKM